jgi:hypothetical protein
MRDELRESLALFPRCSNPWIGITKPSEEIRPFLQRSSEFRRSPVKHLAPCGPPSCANCCASDSVRCRLRRPWQPCGEVLQPVLVRRYLARIKADCRLGRCQRLVSHGGSVTCITRIGSSESGYSISVSVKSCVTNWRDPSLGAARSPRRKAHPRLN